MRGGSEKVAIRMRAFDTPHFWKAFFYSRSLFSFAIFVRYFRSLFSLTLAGEDNKLQREFVLPPVFDGNLGCHAASSNSSTPSPGAIQKESLGRNLQ
jgi:hypothetical protein